MTSSDQRVLAGTWFYDGRVECGVEICGGACDRVPATMKIAAPDGTGPHSRAPLARGAIVDPRVPQVSGKALCSLT